MNSTLMILAVVAAVVCIIFSAFITIKFYSGRKTTFDNKITGFFTLPDDEEKAEITLRELISYISGNEINCFSKIFIKINSENKNVKYICSKICEEYPLFELYENTL